MSNPKEERNKAIVFLRELGFSLPLLGKFFSMTKVGAYNIWKRDRKIYIEELAQKGALIAVDNLGLDKVNSGVYTKGRVKNQIR